MIIEIISNRIVEIFPERFVESLLKTTSAKHYTYSPGYPSMYCK